MSLKELTLLGLASGRKTQIPYVETDLNKNLLHFLQEKEVPIASSCRGRMACHRCYINGENLACAYTLQDFINQFGFQIEIAYL